MLRRDARLPQGAARRAAPRLLIRILGCMQVRIAVLPLSFPQVIDMVLATDMKQHFAILSHFNTVHRLQAYKPNSGGEGGGGTGGGPAAATGNGGGAAAPAAAERPTGLRRAFTG